MFLGFVDVQVNVLVAKLRPVLATAWAEMVLVPDNPGRPTGRPTIRNSTFLLQYSIEVKSKFVLPND